MYKVLAVFVIFSATALAEPPVESSYLPPQLRRIPSQQYGTPNGEDYGNSNDFNSAQPSSYLPPSNNLENDATSGRSNEFDSNQARLLQTYGAPFQDQRSGNLNSDTTVIDSALNAENNFQTSQPAHTYRAPEQSYSVPSPTYGSPKGSTYSSNNIKSVSHHPNGLSSAAKPTFGPSSKSRFGTARLRPTVQPSFRSNEYHQASSYTPRTNGASARYTSAIPSNTYGVPFNSAADNNFGFYNGLSNRNGYSRQQEYSKKVTTEDPLAEPAAYEYTYQVQADDGSGTEFGHKENRENEATRGVYHVLLPDGRMQIVEYEADEGGYRPQIRYEETGYPAGRSAHGGY